MTFPTSASLFKALVHELKETSRAFGAGLTMNQKSNMAYAFAKIQPKSVYELATVIALGVQQKATHEVVDRYMAVRTSCITVFSPYDKIRGMNDELAKTWGLLLYKEHAQALLQELTGKPYRELPATILLDRETLVQCLKAEYKAILSERDINVLHDDLLFYTRIGMTSERWCVGMADRIVKTC